jgi:hypothetical protein
VDPDALSFGCPGSGSLLECGTGSRSMEITKNLQLKLVSCLSKRLLYFRIYVFFPITYLTYIFHVRIFNFKV